MTFEEEFPSLKPINQSLGVRESWKAIDIEQVREYCLDKQRVMTAIDEWIVIERKAGRSASKFEALKKELS